MKPFKAAAVFMGPADRHGTSEPIAKRSALLAPHAVCNEIPRCCAIAVEITSAEATWFCEWDTPIEAVIDRAAGLGSGRVRCISVLLL